MKALTACDKKYLVEYCQEPKNIELALAIGHIQVQLREEILSSFRAKLDQSVKEELSKWDLGRQWETEELPPIDLTLKKNENRELSVEGVLYVITTKDPKIKIELKREGGGIFVGTPKEYEGCPQAADLYDYFENTGLILGSPDSRFRWWAWADPKAKERYTLDDLCILHGESRRKHIAYFTDKLVLSAKAISKALED